MPSADFCRSSHTSRCGLPSDRNVGRTLSSLFSGWFPAGATISRPYPCLQRLRQISPGNAHPPSRLCPLHLQPLLPCRYWTLSLLAPSSRCDCLLCSFCSSSQRFACGFLRIPPRGGHPCRPANSSPCRACRGLSPPSGSALPGAQTKKPRGLFSTPRPVVRSRLPIRQPASSPRGRE
jgi:hypothetical protein